MRWQWQNTRRTSFTALDGASGANTMIAKDQLSRLREDQSHSGADGYRFYRSYVGPEDNAMGETIRSGPGSQSNSLAADPGTWGTDWTEQWVQTWSEHHRDEYDFDVYATVTVNVSWLTLSDVAIYGEDWDGVYPETPQAEITAEGSSCGWCQKICLRGNTSTATVTAGTVLMVATTAIMMEGIVRFRRCGR